MGSISRPSFLRPLPSAPCFDISKETTAFATTRIDWRETPGAHIFTADLPGLRKREVKLEMEEGKVLQINGEGSKVKKEKNDTWHRVKMSSGQFLRAFRLLEKANVGQVKASMENGVLTVTVPKVIAKEPDVKAIAVCG